MSVCERGVLGFLEQSLKNYPDREAYGDVTHSFTYRETADLAQSIGCFLAGKLQKTARPVAVFMDKSIEAVTMYWGILYSGNYYCPIDVEMPVERIRSILSVLEPEFILTNEERKAEAEAFADKIPVCLWEEMIRTEKNAELLQNTAKAVSENDPLYVLFTSGSTGVPKGVLVPHRVITNYLHWLDETYDYSCEDVFGNQAPLYFDVSVHDIFGAAYFGAKMEIIPPHLFGFPLKLVQYLNEKKITTFLWVPSAMGIVAKLKTFRAEKPLYLRHVMFAGEVLPRKQLDYWTANLPDAVYANLYGPTETFVCTAYTYQGNEPEGEPLPIGRVIANSRVIILDEEGKEVPEGETGELCLSGTCLALGYYNNPERTGQAFVKNPANNAYPERIYKTGDLVRLDEHGELIYVSRKDFQIKHMGYRIELGEIETAVSLIPKVGDCVCVYDQKRKTIVLFYDGKKREEEELLKELSARVPSYMLPGRIIHMAALPHNLNGKLDRKALAEQIG